MNACILDGLTLAKKIKKTIQQEIANYVQQGQSSPALHVILVGDDPASHSYVGHKQKACQAVGMASTVHHLPATSSLDDIHACIMRCNQDENVHGILLQLPLPSPLDPTSLLSTIDPDKDVDGFHPYNMGALALRQPGLRPCTPYGVMQLLKFHGCSLKGKHAVIVGASPIVGRPMALELLLEDATITVCHRYTENLSAHVQQADILIVAVGKKNVVSSDWIKPGAVVVDVGFHRDEQGVASGDIDFARAKQKASWITPVPGGVGPMTVATLLQNTLMAYKRKCS